MVRTQPTTLAHTASASPSLPPTMAPEIPLFPPASLLRPWLFLLALNTVMWPHPLPPSLYIPHSSGMVV